MKQLWWTIALLLVPSTQGQDFPRPTKYRQDLSQSALQLVERLMKNDDLQCLPRLLCDYAAGGKPGQSRAINVDTQSLFTLLQYLGLDQNVVTANPMVSFGKAALLGMSYRGDSYECYRNYPTCPRDQTRLLHYLNNHRGGFFRGFSGFSQSYSRIVNKKAFADDITYSNDYNRVPKFIESYVKYSNQPHKFSNIGATHSSNLYQPGSFVNEGLKGNDDSKFVFSDSSRFPKGLGAARPTDRLPSKFHFEENSISNTRFPFSQTLQFFPQY